MEAQRRFSAISLPPEPSGSHAMPKSSGPLDGRVTSTPRVVLVLDEDGDALQGSVNQNELARHKLLDLIGDLFFYGGPPIGRLHARRPGHRRTHLALRAAIAAGAVVREGDAPEDGFWIPGA